MTAGLPGTGIGGLFYLLLVLLMPLREAWRGPGERTDVHRWRIIGGKLAITSGILVALWLEAWTLFVVFGLRQDSLAASLGVSAELTAHVARAASFATLASLGLVLFALALLRVFVRRPLPRAVRCGAGHSRARPYGRLKGHPQLIHFRESDPVRALDAGGS
jgi:hypothetical protein